MTCCALIYQHYYLIYENFKCVIFVEKWNVCKHPFYQSTKPIGFFLALNPFPSPHITPNSIFFTIPSHMISWICIPCNISMTLCLLVKTIAKPSPPKLDLLDLYNPSNHYKILASMTMSSPTTNSSLYHHNFQIKIYLSQLIIDDGCE
jgi:hypothetical protein